MSSLHADEISAGTRFAFGENWTRFLALLTEERVRVAEQSLRDMLQVADLQGRTFLDIGSGSGLFSLAARRLGAHVYSFDFDPASVACTTELRRRFCPDDPHWQVATGSVLDEAFMAGLPAADVVYSWGVLHHTGSMWQAMTNASSLVKPGGLLFIALYNDQGSTSTLWLRVKQAYNSLPEGLRFLVLWPATLRLWGPTMVKDLLRGEPARTWRNYSTESLRGMSPWRDVVDWVGGLPFEVASRDAVDQFLVARGFSRLTLRSVDGGLGCNEFVYIRPATASRDRG